MWKMLPSICWDGWGDSADNVILTALLQQVNDQAQHPDGIVMSSPHTHTLTHMDTHTYTMGKFPLH